MRGMWRLTFLVIAFSWMGLSCANNPERFYFGNYSEAEALYARGEYDKAIQKYQAYIDENPEGNMAVISKYYIAKSRIALGETEEGRMILEDITKQHPDVVWANFAETQLKELNKNSNV